MIRRLQKSTGDNALVSFPGGQELHNVILVGGATRIPAVRRLVRTVTGIDPPYSVHPDEAVALGAAVLAGVIDDRIEGMQVLTAWQAAMYRAFYEEQLLGRNINTLGSKDNDDDSHNDNNDDKNNENKNKNKNDEKNEDESKIIKNMKTKKSIFKRARK